MKIKLTKKQSIIIITITTLLLIIGLYFIFKTPKKPIPTKTFDYDNNQTYEHNLERWKSECLFKPGINYNCFDVRNKLGRNNRTLYCLNKETIKDIYDTFVALTTNFETQYDSDRQCYVLYYHYDYGPISDDWYFKKYKYDKPGFIVGGCHNNNIYKVGSSTLYGLGDFISGGIDFETYVDTTPPPNPPQTN